MVKTLEQIKENVEQDIEQFTTNFYNKYGVKVIVLYNLKTDKVLAIIIELANCDYNIAVGGSEMIQFIATINKIRRVLE